MEKVYSEEYYKRVKEMAVKVPDGIAEGATINGAICAARNGSSALGRFVAKDTNRKNYLLERERKDQRRNIAGQQSERAKQKKGPTQKQLALAAKWNIELPPQCTAAQAYRIIGKKVKHIKKLKSVRQKRGY